MIIGKKIKMTQIFDQAGKVIPATLLSCDSSNLKVGQKIKITGLGKGKGFQGVVKRWGFRGAPATHGTKHAHREPGSIGIGGVQKVFKGRKMPGRMGSKKTTIKNLEILEIKGNQIAIQGAIPGPRNSELKIYEN